MKYITYFNTDSNYQIAKPDIEQLGTNVSYTEDNDLVRYWTKPVPPVDQKPFIINYESGYTSNVKLPIAGIVNAFVDWGDGSPIEHVVTEKPTHVYEFNEDYGAYMGTVKVTGTFTKLDGDNNDGMLGYVTSWGDETLGLQEIYHLNVSTLPSDDYGAFKNIEHFTESFAGMSEGEQYNAISDQLFKHAQKAKSFIRTWANSSYFDSVLSSIPINTLFKPCVNVEIFDQTFIGCLGVANDMEYSAFRGLPKVKVFKEVFGGSILGEYRWLALSTEDMLDLEEFINPASAGGMGVDSVFLPWNIFDNNTKLKKLQLQYCKFDNPALSGTFSDITRIFKNKPNLTDLSNTFLSSKDQFDNTNYYIVSDDMFNGSKNINNFNNLFKDFTLYKNDTYEAVATPKENGLELWELAGTPGYPAVITGGECFKGGNWTNYANIPENWK